MKKLLFVALLLVPSSAFADLLTVNAVDHSQGIFGGIHMVLNGNTILDGAGSFSGTLNGNPIPEMFCVDLTRGFVGGLPASYQVTPTPVTSLVKPPSNLATGGLVGALLHLSAAQLAAPLPGSVPAGASTLHQVQQAALQLAIWNAVYDGTPYNTGAFQFVSAGTPALTSVLSAVEQAYLADVTGQSNSNAVWLDPVLNANGKAPGQDMVYPTTGVPEPGSMLLAALSGVGLIFARRRNRTVAA